MRLEEVLEWLTYQLVFANYPFEVEHYRRRVRLAENQVRFVKDGRTLGGLHIEHRPVYMPFVGGFYRRADAEELVAYARQIGIIVCGSFDPRIYDPTVVHGIPDKYL